MTNSQLRSVVALIATFISTMSAAIVPQIQHLPPRFKVWGTIVSIIGAAAGSVVMVLNQSLSPNHVSIPVERARELGIATDSSTKPKEGE